MSSKKKGKPLGISTHLAEIPTASSSRNALYESTEVLDTMFVGAMCFALDTVEEGGVPEPLQTSLDNNFETLSQQSSEDFDLPSENVPNNPIGDLYAFYLELMVQGAQPYPGDPNWHTSEECFDEKRFLSYWISETQYIVMDSELDEDHTLEAAWLKDPEFMPVCGTLEYAPERLDSVQLNLSRQNTIEAKSATYYPGRCKSCLRSTSVAKAGKSHN
jgi:hypothetical protein